MSTGQSKNDRGIESGHSTHVVSVSTLVTVAISLVIGGVGAMVLRNALESEAIAFSTPALITLLFGISLSLASIVLAIAAISLGRNSESAMTRRSDESIRLQNEVFTKTTEALARIESSTGVTEKRIEDIISGRAGIISDRITEKLLQEPGLETKKRADIEQEVRESIMSQLTDLRPSTSSKESETQRRKKKEQAERFADFHDSVLLAIANLDKIKALKVGEGYFDKTGDELVDGVYELKGRKIAVCVQSAHGGWLETSRNGILRQIRSLAGEVSKGVFAEVFMAFDRDVNDETELKELLDDLRLITREELVEKITIVSGSADHVVSQISAKLAGELAV